MTALERYLGGVKGQLTEAHSNCATCGAPASVRAGDSETRYYRPALPRETGDRLVAMVERSRQELVAVQERFHSELCEETCCGACKSLTDAMAELDRIAGEDGT
jgi:hypothetical protein